MTRNARLVGLSIYHPEFCLDNDYYINHFDKQGKDIRRFLEHMGRNRRFIIQNNEENTLTMAEKVALDVLKKTNLKGSDIDLIIVATQTPEYTMPSNAIVIHDCIEANLDTITMDINSNCGGMLTSMDTASRHIMTNKDVNRALVIGSDFNRLVSSPDDEITYPNLGDGAAAIILEATEEPTGFMDSIFHSNPVVKDKILFPPSGLTNMISENTHDNFMNWIPFSTDPSNKSACMSIERILSRNNLTIEDISIFCFSQFSLADIKKITNHFSIDMDTVSYVGDQYGYTGVSSPFFALHEAINKDKIKRGEYILFWAVGGGFQTVTTLMKY